MSPEETNTDENLTDDEFINQVLDRDEDRGEGLEADLDLENLVAEAEKLLAGGLGVTLPEDETDNEEGEEDGGEGSSATADSTGDSTTPTPEPDADPSTGTVNSTGEGEGSEGSSEDRGADTVGSPPPGATTDTTDTTNADPTANADPEWERIGSAWETLTGSRPTYDDLIDLHTRAQAHDQIAGRINALPEGYQQVVVDMIEGRFDPQSFAREVLSSDHDEDDDGYVDPTVAELQALRRDLQQQQVQTEQQQQAQIQAQFQARVEQDMERVFTDLKATGLPDDQLVDIATKVQQRGVWWNEAYQTGDPYNAYLKHFRAHAIAEGLDVNLGAAQTPPPAPAPTSAPTASASPAPASPAPLTPEQEQRSAERQAASSAISGTSAPVRRRRSPMSKGGDAATDERRPQTPAELEAAIAEAAQEMFG